jgi:hypothetical protein
VRATHAVGVATGIVLVLSPCAALGNATADHTGLVLADLAFTVVAAINAVLGIVVAQRMGMARSRWTADQRVPHRADQPALVIPGQRCSFLASRLACAAAACSRSYSSP